MPLSVRIILFGFIGVIAGLLAWPFTELILFYQASFPSLLLFSMIIGIIIGFLMGGCFGLGEGIISHAYGRIIPGMLMGMIIGTIGGLIGFVIGQAALLLLGTTFFNSVGSFRRFGFPLSKALGWGAFGLCIGSIEGIRSKSLNKVFIGIAGGLTGGIIGGLVFEYLRVSNPENPYLRLAGLLILGLLIGICYGIFENRMSSASLYLLNGRFKGKEFLLNKRTTSIGKSEQTEIPLEGYRKVADIHAEIKKNKNDYLFVLKEKSESTQMVTCINDGQTEQKKLSNGDIIRVGNAQLQFRIR